MSEPVLIDSQETLNRIMRATRYTERQQRSPTPQDGVVPDRMGPQTAAGPVNIVVEVTTDVPDCDGFYQGFIKIRSTDLYRPSASSSSVSSSSDEGSSSSSTCFPGKGDKKFKDWYDPGNPSGSTNGMIEVRVQEINYNPLIKQRYKGYVAGTLHFGVSPGYELVIVEYDEEICPCPPSGSSTNTCICINTASVMLWPPQVIGNGLFLTGADLSVCGNQLILCNFQTQLVGCIPPCPEVPSGSSSSSGSSGSGSSGSGCTPCQWTSLNLAITQRPSSPASCENPPPPPACSPFQPGANISIPLIGGAGSGLQTFSITLPYCDGCTVTLTVQVYLICGSLAPLPGVAGNAIISGTLTAICPSGAQTGGSFSGAGNIDADGNLTTVNPLVDFFGVCTFGTFTGTCGGGSGSGSGACTGVIITPVGSSQVSGTGSAIITIPNVTATVGQLLKVSVHQTAGIIQSAAATFTSNGTLTLAGFSEYGGTSNNGGVAVLYIPITASVSNGTITVTIVHTLLTSVLAQASADLITGLTNNAVNVVSPSTYGSGGTPSATTGSNGSSDCNTVISTIGQVLSSATSPLGWMGGVESDGQDQDGNDGAVTPTYGTIQTGYEMTNAMGTFTSTAGLSTAANWTEFSVGFN
jgi:hypothetical protein